MSAYHVFLIDKNIANVTETSFMEIIPSVHRPSLGEEVQFQKDLVISAF